MVFHHIWQAAKMSSNSTATQLHGGRGRGGSRGSLLGGRGRLPPSRIATNLGSGSDSSQTLAPGVADSLHFTMPVSITHHSIKQYQAFLRQFAWIAVRQQELMRVAAQKKTLMTEYKGFIKLYMTSQMVYSNDCFPPVPAALTQTDPANAFNILMQSTARKESVLSEDALHKKAKRDVTTILKFMGDWCRECPNEGRQPNQLVPAGPPSGIFRDEVYTNIMQKWWRTAQCLRVYKLRLSNSSLPENSADAIRSSLMSYNFAKRGVTLQQEQFYRTQSVPEDPTNVHYQVEAETNAGYIQEENSSDDDEPSGTGAASQSQSTHVGHIRQRAPSSGLLTQPSYHELQFPDPYKHELEFCFKCVQQNCEIMHPSSEQQVFFSVRGQRPR
jgi:hypothetical protein